MRMLSSPRHPGAIHPRNRLFAGWARRLARLLACAATLACLPAFAATTLNVNTTAMTLAGDGLCSLPEAMEAARSNATVNDCVALSGPPFTINLQAGADYNLTTVGNANASFGNSAYLHNGSHLITINGNGATIRQSGQSQRLFLVSGTAQLIIRNATVSGGNAFDPAVTHAGFGGAIYTNGGVVSLENVNLINHFSSISASAIYATGPATVNLHRVTVTATSSNSTGDIILIANGAILNMANSTLDGRSGSPGNGIIALDGSTVNISGSTIAENTVLGARASDIAVSSSILTQGCIYHSGGTVTFTKVASDSAACSPVTFVPTLPALSDNGGQTLTIMPTLPVGTKDAAPGCTYLSTGTNPLFTHGAPITIDQRGFPRDANCDIGAVEAMTLSPGSLPTGSASTPYSVTLSQSGGAAPVTFSLASGVLPPGLTLNSATGEISGTSTSGSFVQFEIMVTDSAGFKTLWRYSLVMAQLNQTLTFNTQSTPARTFVAGSSFQISPLATASSGLTPTYQSGSTAVCTISGTTVTMVSGGACIIQASQLGNGTYFSAPSVTQTVTLNPGPQALTFGAQLPQIFGPGGTYAINPVATSSAGLAVTHSSLTPSICTVTGTSFTIVSAGTCTLAADQAGNTSYLAAPQVTRTVSILPAAQLVSVSAIPPKTLGDLPFVVSATGGGSGNPVLWTSLTPTVCTSSGVNGSLVTLLIAGTCTLRASQAGNANYLAAANVDRSFFVGSGNSSVTLESSANPSPYRTPVTFTARVSGVMPTGIVRLMNGSVTLCDAQVTGAVATCTVSDLMEDAHSIRAYYLGDANNLGAFSTELVQIVPRVGKRQGAWWGGPTQNGWGLSIVEHGNTLVAGWYFYNAAGQPTWLTLNGCQWESSGTRCSGALTRSESSWLGAYRADRFRSQVVGSATLAFDEQGGLFSYVVDGVAGSKRIERLDLGPNPFAPFDFTDVWWGGAGENGWGVSAHVAGQSITGIWYTYNTAGEPTWYLFNSGQQLNPRVFRAVLYRTQGSPLNQTYNPAQFSVVPVGSIYFDFDDVRNGTMTYQLDGLLQFKPFARVPF